LIQSLESHRDTDLLSWRSESLRPETECHPPLPIDALTPH
jgi:hypothetical protein